MTRQREARIETLALELTEKLGGRLEKLPPTAGVNHRPDRLLVFPMVAPAYLELKRPGEEPSPEQAEAMNRLEEQGFFADWFNDWSELRMFILGVAEYSRRRRNGNRNVFRSDPR